MSELDEAILQAVRDAACKHRRATVSEVSLRTGAARSTIHRTARKLGYGSWLDFTNSMVRSLAELVEQDAVTTTVAAMSEVFCRYRNLPILIEAVGDAEICGLFLLHRLAERGFTPLPYSEGILALGGGAEGAGLLLAINESGMSLLPICLTAASQGFEVASITASHDTPVSKVSSMNVVIKNNKSTIAAYEPNYFTAGTLAFLAHVLRRISIENALGRR